MSSNMQGLLQQPITKSTRRKAGGPLGIAPPNKSSSLRPDLMNAQFGLMKVTSPEVVWRRIGRWQHAHLRCECLGCGKALVRDMSRLQSNPPKHGCRDCYLKAMDRQSATVPDWLVRRCKGMRLRCSDETHKAWPDYGGRGIEFRFLSPRACAQWVVQNLGLPKQDRNTQLDRVDNNGHYEPGNLRWASKALNCNNTRRGGWVAMMHRFRMEHPEIRYADKTLRNLFAMGLTFEQVVERFYRPSDKPKGLYGTYSKPDPEIASLAKDC